MSVICLICKDKLLNNAPGSSLGSLNSLVENQVIATGCGHLYHAECLHCWFRTQKKKLKNQGITEIVLDHCPTCQVEVSDDQIRRIHLLEDHREALEKAKLLERMENLEIYCHELEINIQQLKRENDLLLNKVLAPSNQSLGKASSIFSDDFAAIVKNDRVVWLKNDSPPQAGVVLSIFKKDGSLWVKLKLDKKIKTNQRTGLFGSFRFDKRQEMTVPFQDIVLEKDFKRENGTIDENSESSSEPSTPTHFVPLQKVPSFRSSTMSLPGEYMGQQFSAMRAGNVGGGGLQPILSYDFINNYGHGSNLELSSPALISEHQSNPVFTTVVNTFPTQVPQVSATQVNQNDLEQNRDYIMLNPPKNMNPLNGNSANNEGRTTPQDGKGKHVTFADDLRKNSLPQTSSPKVARGNHFRDHDYRNVPEMQFTDRAKSDVREEDQAEMEEVSITITEYQNEEEPAGEISPIKPDSQDAVEPFVSSVSSIKLPEPSASSTPCSSLLSITGELQPNTDLFEQTGKPVDPEKNFNGSCFDVMFTVLFYKCDTFDRLLLLRNASHDNIQQSVQNVLMSEFVNPVRSQELQKFDPDYSNKLYETIAHLCSNYLDLEELMTILFEYVFKIPPFISYSYDMCDYIHQFFIDFTDKEKTRTVQQLFEQSLTLQDNLKLCAEPSPALILQMPNSEEGIIHYDAIIPTLSLRIDHCLENGDENVVQELTCYCNKTATLECAKCAEVHGKSPVLFCEDCSILLEAIHNDMYHKLELSPIKHANTTPVSLELVAVICLKSERYSAFLRNASVEADYSNRWLYIEDFDNGLPQFVKLPDMEEWINSVTLDTSSFSLDEISRFQRKLLTECRMFLYAPKHNSFA